MLTLCPSPNTHVHTCAAVENASEALDQVNGYKMRDRPVIISYGRTDSK